MKRFLLIYSTFILPLLSFSQVQITDFKNIEATSPSNFQFIDTLNNRLLFSTFAAEQKKTYALWATDGTIENTKKLVDEKGERPIYVYGKFKAYGYLYFRGENIWRTNGNTLESIIGASDSLNSIYQVDDKILVYFQRIDYLTTEVKNSLYWLDSQNKLTFFDKNISAYKIIDNELHYLKFNTSNSKWELYRYSKNNNQLIVSFNSVNQNFNGFNYFSYEGTEYYLIGIPQKSRLIALTRSRNEVIVKDWGDRVYMYAPFIIRDESDNPNLFKMNDDSIVVYSLAQKTLLKEVFVAAIKDVLKDPTTPPYYHGYRLFRNKLSFWSSHGGYSITYYFAINEYDFKTKKYRISKNLKERLGNLSYSTLPELKPLSENEYEINNGFGQIFKYSFEKDTISLFSTYPIVIAKPDSGFIVNNTKLLLRDNLYKINGKDTISMIPQKKIFSPNNSYGTNFLSKQLNNKLLFWFYDETTKQNQLWVSNGEKGGNEKLMSFDYDFPSYLDIYQDKLQIIDNQVYFYMTNYKKLSIYVTDGTKNGTKMVWKADSANYKYVEAMIANKHQVVYRINTTVERKIIIIENGVANEIRDIPTSKFGFDVYLTSSNIYIVTNDERNGQSYQKLFKIENMKFKLIDDESYDYKIYQDKIYYTKISNGNSYTGIYYYDEANDKIISLIKSNIDEYGIYGNKLVFMTRTQQNGGNTTNYTIKDLSSDKPDITFTYTFPANSFISFNISNLADNSLIFSTYKKIIVIKNNIKKEIDPKYTLFGLPQPFGNGILIQESLDNGRYPPVNLSYYDLNNSKITPILENTPYQQVLLDTNAQFILILFAQDSNKVKWKQWNNNTQQLQDLDGDFREINCNSVIERNKTNDTYWTFDGQKLNKSYEIYDFTYKYLKRQNLYFNTKNGNIIALGRDSVITLARMTNENEGFNIYDIFQFNKQLYAYTFTYNEGYQVWKLPLTTDKLNQLLQNCSTLFYLSDALSTEESDAQINIFPNPASQSLFISVDQNTDYQIIDLKGSIIMKGKVSSTEPINISTLQPNSYFIRLQHEKLSAVKRFMKF